MKCDALGPWAAARRPINTRSGGLVTSGRRFLGRARPEATAARRFSAAGAETCRLLGEMLSPSAAAGAERGQRRRWEHLPVERKPPTSVHCTPALAALGALQLAASAAAERQIRRIRRRAALLPLQYPAGPAAGAAAAATTN